MSDHQTSEDLTSEAANLLSSATMQASQALAHAQDGNTENLVTSLRQAIVDAEKAVALLKQV